MQRTIKERLDLALNGIATQVNTDYRYIVAYKSAFGFFIAGFFIALLGIIFAVFVPLFIIKAIFDPDLAALPTAIRAITIVALFAVIASALLHCGFHIMDAPPTESEIRLANKHEQLLHDVTMPSSTNKKLRSFRCDFHPAPNVTRGQMDLQMAYQEDRIDDRWEGFKRMLMIAETTKYTIYRNKQALLNKIKTD